MSATGLSSHVQFSAGSRLWTQTLLNGLKSQQPGISSEHIKMFFLTVFSEAFSEEFVYTIMRRLTAALKTTDLLSVFLLLIYSFVFFWWIFPHELLFFVRIYISDNPPPQVLWSRCRWARKGRSPEADWALCPWRKRGRGSVFSFPNISSSVPEAPEGNSTSPRYTGVTPPCWLSELNR